MRMMIPFVGADAKPARADAAPMRAGRCYRAAVGRVADPPLR